MRIDREDIRALPTVEAPWMRRTTRHRLTGVLGVAACLLASACSSAGSTAGSSTTTSSPITAATTAATAAQTTATPTTAATTSTAGTTTVVDPSTTTVSTTTVSSSTTTVSTSMSAPSRTDYDTPEGLVRLICAGAGAVPVVLMAGGNDPPNVWDDVVRELGDSVLTCRFDPSAIDTDITATRRSDALSAALDAAALSPALLVGHSLAGLTIREFGADHPDQFAGAVLLDPTTPSSLGPFHADLAALGWDVDTLQADADAAVTWPSVPVRVLSHDPSLGTLGSEELEDEWTAGQEAYAALSPLGIAGVVPGSDHFVYVSGRNTVVAAIDDVVGEIG